jgi:exoribonuclease R
MGKRHVSMFRNWKRFSDIAGRHQSMHAVREEITVYCTSARTLDISRFERKELTSFSMKERKISLQQDRAHKNIRIYSIFS